MVSENDLKEQLEKIGFDVVNIKVQPRLLDTVLDFLIRVKLDGRKINLVVEVKERPHLAQLRLVATMMKRYAESNMIPVIAAPFLGPNRRALLKELGIGYIDMAGNVFLKTSGVFIEREQSRNPFGYERDGLNPYADKASIVLRILMDEPTRSWKIRELAKTGDINPGWVSRVVDSLVERGLVEFNRKNGISLLRGEDGLKEWADLYDWHRNRFYYYYCHALDSQDILEKISKLRISNNKLFALGFQAGAYLVSPYSTFNQVHLVIDGRSFDILRPEIENQLALESKREGANLILVHPYYKYSALFGSRKIKKWQVVSDIQLYLDLNKYPLRGKEQAAHLLEKVIQPRLNNSTRGIRGSKQN